jgi:hypothetical protein
MAAAMTDAIAHFIASGDEASLRIPYLTLEHPTAGILPRLGELSERSKALYMVACIRHAWDEHLSYGVDSTLPTDVLTLVDTLLEGRPCAVEELRAQLEAFQHVHDVVVEDAKANVPGAVTAANLTYVIGALASWIYHALVALAGDSRLTWLGYSVATQRWLPLWLVLSGTASTDPGERAWQIKALNGFVDRPLPEIDPTDAAWLQHQMEIGTTYLTLCLAPWDMKRSLVESHPDIVDPVRRAFAKIVMRRAVKAGSDAAQTGADEHLWSLIDANDVLLDWCHAVMADAHELGSVTRRGLDSVFDNAELRAMIERVGAQTS